MDANGIVMVGLAKNQSMPIIFKINPLNGQIYSFTSLDKIRYIPEEEDQQEGYPKYARKSEFDMFRAIYHDVNDKTDGQPYYYLSFVEHVYNNIDTNSESLAEDIMHIVKINSVSGSIIYDYKNKAKTSLGSVENFRVPGLLFNDPTDSSNLFLFGQWEQTASVMKFSKTDVTVDYIMQI